MNESLKNILIIKPSSLGDIVQALPALSALYRNFPGAKINWLTRTEFVPLIKNHPHLTSTIPFDRKLLGKAWYSPRAFIALVHLIGQLRTSRFDVVIDFQGLFRTAALAWLSGCKKRVGTAKARERAHIFYTHRVPQTPDCINLVDYYLKMVQVLGAKDIRPEFILPADPAATGRVHRILTQHNVNIDNYMVLIPSSTRTDKRWPAEKFAILADKIAAEFASSIVATGTDKEKGTIKQLKNQANVSIANLAGSTTISELVALLQSARIVISNDTGPGHIAAALGTPIVMIFGRSNPARVAPYKRDHCVAAIEPHLRGNNINSTNPRHDIKAVTIDDVYQKVCSQLQEKPPSHNPKNHNRLGIPSSKNPQ